MRTTRFALLAIALLGACIPHCGEYKYFDLSAMQGARIDEIGVPGNERLDGVHPFPLAYVVERDDYVLRATVLPVGSLPNIRFQAAAPGGAGLMVTRAALPKSLAHCVTTSSNKQTDGAITLVWFGGQGCEAVTQLTLMVTDLRGAQIGEEVVPVRLVPNGRFCEGNAP